MTFRPEDWPRVKSIFDAALTFSGPARSAYVASACAADATLRAQVEALLASHERSAAFLEPLPSSGAAAPSADDMTGRTVSGYSLLAQIGSGGMGDVYLARDDKLDRRVAVKFLSRSLHTDPAQLRRFLQEAKAASSLNHPHILVVHDVGELDGRPFIVTEYIEGTTLRARLQQGSLGTIGAVDIATQIAAALAAAHEQGLVHRDVKPENVMLRPDGYVKVLDFGLAKTIGPLAATGETMTQPGLVMGTPQYMSPEQARGLPLDARSDVWSLGVVLYEMIAGRPPFRGASIADIIAATLHAAPPPLTGTPPAVVDCVLRALGKTPDQRYATAREMHAALLALKAYDSVETAAEADLPRAARAPRRTRRAIDSIAVLPLTYSGGSSELDYLADGITDSLIIALSQLPKLRVMARSTVFRYKVRGEMDPLAIGRELGVRAVLVGRLRATPDALIISAELVDAIDGTQIWGGQLQRRSEDALALQEEAAAGIADQLRPRLTPADRTRVAKRHTANPRAFEAHLKGRYYLAKRTLDGFTKAIASFEEAIAEDRNYALAYAGLADCWTLLSAAAYGEPSARTMARAREAAGHAVRLDPNDTEVQTALGFVRFRIDWDWRGAEEAFRRACELGPAHAPAHHRFALLLSALGRHAEAHEAIHRARDLDPLSLIITTAVGRVLHFARRYDDAIAQCRRALEMDPAFVQAHFDLGMAYAQAGRHEEAIAEFESVLKPDDPRSLMLGVLGHIYARAGRIDQAADVVATLERRYRRGEAASYDLALPLIGLDRVSDGCAWLERACDTRSGLLVFLNVEPMYDSIRTEPRFASLVRRLGFAHR